MDSKYQTCRTCLLLCESTLCISTSVEVPSLQNTKYPLIDVLRMFTDLPVSPSQPEYICKICLDEIQETYSFKLRYDTRLTEQPTDNATKNTNDKILNEEQIKQEDNTDEFSELVTLKKAKLFVQEVKEEPEIDITDSLNETNPHEKCLQNNLQCKICVDEIQKTYSFKLRYDTSLTEQPMDNVTKNTDDFHSEHEHHADTIIGLIKTEKDNEEYEILNEKQEDTTDEFSELVTLKEEIFFVQEVKEEPEIDITDSLNETNLNENNLQCTKIVQSEENLKVHRSVHSDYYPYECKICPQSFRCKFGLITHKIMEHGMAQCKQCSHILESKYLLSQHIFRFHIEKQIFNPFRCDFCTAEFAYDYNLTRHLQTTHPTQKGNFKCTICPKSFRFMSRLNRHMIVHSDPRYQCDICPNEYSHKDNLQAHLRDSHRKKSQAHLRTSHRKKSQAAVEIAAQLQKVYDIQKRNKVEQRKK